MWKMVPGLDVKYKLFYRINGEENWQDYGFQSGNNRLAVQLQHSTEYEFKVIAVCEGDTIYSTSSAFQTTKSTGSCLSKFPPYPGGLYLNSISTNLATFFWSPILDMNFDAGYIISYGISNMNPNTWSQFVVCKPETSFKLINLAPNTNYSIRIRTNCTNCTTALKNTDKRSNWSEIINFKTTSFRMGEGNTESQTQLNEILFYPNPNDGSFTIQSDRIFPCQIEIFDILNRKIFNDIIESNYQSFNFRDLPSGAYTIILKNISEQKILKWIKLN